MAGRASDSRQTLSDFNYKFEDGCLVDICTGERFIFEVSPDHSYNQRHYEALGEVITEHVYELLESLNVGLKKLEIPIGKKQKADKGFIFVSNDYDKQEKLMVLVHGSGVVRAGQWARRLIINDCIDHGTQIPYIKRALKEGYGVVVLNTNQNEVEVVKKGKKKFVDIKESETPEKHFSYVWKNVIQKANACKIFVVAHSYGGYLVVDYFNQNKKIVNRVVAVAFTDSVHSLNYQTSGSIREWFEQNSVNWVTSSNDLDTPMPNQHQHITRVSAGTTRHEETSWKAMNSVFRYFENKNMELSKPGSEATHKDSVGEQSTEMKSDSTAGNCAIGGSIDDGAATDYYAAADGASGDGASARADDNGAAGNGAVDEDTTSASATNPSATGDGAADSASDNSATAGGGDAGATADGATSGNNVASEGTTAEGTTDDGTTSPDAVGDGAMDDGAASPGATNDSTADGCTGDAPCSQVPCNTNPGELSRDVAVSKGDESHTDTKATSETDFQSRPEDNEQGPRAADKSRSESTGSLKSDGISGENTPISGANSNKDVKDKTSAQDGKDSRSTTIDTRGSQEVKSDNGARVSNENKDSDRIPNPGRADSDKDYKDTTSTRGTNQDKGDRRSTGSSRTNDDEDERRIACSGGTDVNKDGNSTEYNKSTASSGTMGDDKHGKDSGTFPGVSTSNKDVCNTSPSGNEGGKVTAVEAETQNEDGASTTSSSEVCGDNGKDTSSSGGTHQRKDAQSITDQCGKHDEGKEGTICLDKTSDTGGASSTCIRKTDGDKGCESNTTPSETSSDNDDSKDSTIPDGKKRVKNGSRDDIDTAPEDTDKHPGKPKIPENSKGGVNDEHPDKSKL